MRYPVVIHKDADSDYGVTIPDLPGCFSAGASVDEALDGAVEAIACHVEGLLIDAEDIPMPVAIDVHKENPDFADGLWALVDVDLSKLSGKIRRVNVTIPERILNRIDDCAKRQGESRSGLITAATIEYMAVRSEASANSQSETAA